MAARASRIATTIGVIALATLLAACSTGVDADDESVGASASPTPSASPEPTPEPTTFTTQNGTATFLVPDGWTVEDTSALQPTSNHGGPVWLNAVALLDEDGVLRATYSDGYADDVGAYAERGLVQSLPMADALHAAAWWTTAGDGGDWFVGAAVVADPANPQRTVIPAGFDRLHSFEAGLGAVPECADVVDEASAVACLEAPGTTEALELLATLDLEPLPWDAMPEGLDPHADVPWVDFVSADGAVTFSHPASWSIRTHDPAAGAPGDTFVTVVTPDGYEALDVRLSTVTPQQIGTWCDVAPSEGWEPFLLIAAEEVDPVVGASVDPGPLQLATFDLRTGQLGVALLPVDRVELGCFDPTIAIGTGSMQLSTPYGTDASGLISDRFPGGEGFVGSYEHDVMLEVARSLEIRA